MGRGCDRQFPGVTAQPRVQHESQSGTLNLMFTAPSLESGDVRMSPITTLLSVWIVLRHFARRSRDICHTAGTKRSANRFECSCTLIGILKPCVASAAMWCVSTNQLNSAVSIGVSICSPGHHSGLVVATQRNVTTRVIPARSNRCCRTVGWIS